MALCGFNYKTSAIALSYIEIPIANNSENKLISYKIYAISIFVN